MADGGRDLGSSNGGIDFGLKSVVDPSSGDDVEHGGADSGGGGVGASDQLEHSFGTTLGLGEAVPDEGALRGVVLL